MSVRRWPSLLSALVLVVAACGGSPDEPAANATAAGSILADTAVSSSTASSALATAATTVVDETISSTTETTGDDPGNATSTPTTVDDTSGSTTTATTSASTAPTAPSTTETTAASTVIRLRLDRRVDDTATEGFDSFVRAVLTDERGWKRAGFRFAFDDTDFDYTVVLAEGSEVDALCLPYDTYGRYSCQIGPVVALNADRWRTAVDVWPATLDEYRTMLVNHEVGHLLGQHHPASRCAGDGQPAPVMAQQSSGVAPCTANPWPLQWEIACAGQGIEPLAPPYERDITLTCGPDGPVD